MELEDKTFQFNSTRPLLMFDNASLSDIDVWLDGTVEGNLSYLVCPMNNFTYLNVTCEPTFELSLPLLGEYFYIKIYFKLLFL